MIRAFVVDDEELAVKRLVRLLAETGRVEVSGSSTDPIDALAALNEKPVEVLFLDIQMPGMTGFEMLACLDPQPLVVFTTAFDQYALRAFEVNSIDYLLKPIETSQLARALDKIERLRAAPSPRARLEGPAGSPHAIFAHRVSRAHRIARRRKDSNYRPRESHVLLLSGQAHLRRYRVQELCNRPRRR